MKTADVSPFVAVAAGAGLGSVGAVAAVSTAGTATGLGAIGMTSGLAAVGSVVGGGMAAGLMVTAAIPVAAGVASYFIYRATDGWFRSDPTVATTSTDEEKTDVTTP